MKTLVAPTTYVFTADYNGPDKPLGRYIYMPAGVPVEVSDAEAAMILQEPGFVDVTPAPVTAAAPEPTK